MLFNQIKTNYLEISLTSPEPLQLTRFNLILHSLFNLRQLRGVGVKFMNASARTPKGVLINIIWEYFKNSIPTPLAETRTHFTNIIDPGFDWFLNTRPSPLLSSFGIWNSEFIGETEQLYSHLFRMTGDYIDLGTGMISEQGTQKYNIVTELDLDTVEEVECECSICYENIKCMDMVKLNCTHHFCGTCIKRSLTAHSNRLDIPRCALCREQIIKFSVKSIDVYNLISEHCN